MGRLVSNLTDENKGILRNVKESRRSLGIMAAVLIIVIAFAAPVSAADVGAVAMTVDDSAVTFDADCVSDFDWDLSDQGDSMTITANCSLDTSSVRSQYGRLIQFHVIMELDKWLPIPQQWIAVQDDEWTQPSYPNRISTLVWPVNDYASDTLTVTWDNAGQGLNAGEQYKVILFGAISSETPPGASPYGKWDDDDSATMFIDIVA
jgi:hypothetical protein